MSRFLVARFSSFVNKLDNILNIIFRHGNPPPQSAFSLTVMSSSYGSDFVMHQQYYPTQERLSLKEIIGNGFLWAVPKHRRTVEKRLNRKFGHPDYVWKPLKVKDNLRMCNQCGHDHEVGVLCPHCYAKLQEETKLIQQKIQAKLGLNPIDRDIVICYDGENNEQMKEEANGKRIIEMEKPRPMWFSKNLMQKSTQQPADTAEVKPNDLA